jgi:hypothetical protein
VASPGGPGGAPRGFRGTGRFGPARGFNPGGFGNPGAFGPPPGFTGGPLTGGPLTGTGAKNGGAAIGGLLNGSKPTAALVAALDQNAGQYTWVAATVGANEASGYQLATGKPVMALGGFNGTDPWPTLAQFEQDVQQGKIHYFIAGAGGFGAGGFGGGAGRGSSVSPTSQISSWVASHFTAQTVGGVTLYDLTPG